MRGVLAGALRFPCGGGRAPARAALGGDPATRAAAPVERAPLASDLRRVIPWAVSLKIVFNGQEYDSVDAMPPDVRKERSEEHTSELQSLAYLVCRLLLEKKKHIKVADIH